MYLSDIQSYFQSLAELHADIRHGQNGRTAFFRLQGMGPLQQVPNNLGDMLVSIERFSGRAVGEYDAAKLQQFIQIRFAKYLVTPADGDFEAAINACMDESMLVMFDFVSKMRKDYYDDTCSWLQRVNLAGISWVEFDGPWIENHYGWDLTIPYLDSFPGYRWDKWI